MANVNGLVQEVVVAGGFVCFWVGPTRNDATLLALALYGAVPEASNNGVAASLIVTSHLCGLRVNVTTSDATGRITKVESAAQNKAVAIDVSTVADDYPYPPKNHNHDAAYAKLAHDHAGVYAPVAHDHGNVYAPVGHNHDLAYAPNPHEHDLAYAKVVHAHDHQTLVNRLTKQHTLAVETTLTRGLLFGDNLRELAIGEAELGGLALELGAAPLAAYAARNGMSTLSATIVDGGVTTRVLAATMAQNVAAADLRWDVRLFVTNTGAEYSPEFAGSSELVSLTIVTHLDAP